MLDVDCFKAFNDRYGHPSGDACLQTITHLLRDCGRHPQDLVARYGNEEFTIILTNTDVNGALEVAKNIPVGIAARAITHERSTLEHATLSIGLASTQALGCDTPEKLIHLADAALYEAEQLGRHRAKSCGTGRAYNLIEPRPEKRAMRRSPLPAPPAAPNAQSHR